MTQAPFVPEGWELTTLGQAFRWGSGGTPRRDVAAYYGGDIPWAIIGDLNDGLVTRTSSTITEAGLQNSSAKWVKPGSVLVAMYGSIGKLGLAGIPLTTNQALAFTDPAPIPARYLLYYLQHVRPQLVNAGKGGTQSNISQTVIRQFPFLLAPSDLRDRIVAKIDELFSDLDTGVAALERAKAKLKRYRAAVLKAAVEGRLTEEWRREHPDVEPASELLKRILAERRKRWEEDQLAKYGAKGMKAPTGWREKYKEPATPLVEALPSLPEQWCWATVDQLIASELINGRSVPTAVRGFHVLRLTALKGDRIDLAERKVGSWDESDARRYLVKKGDMLVARGSGSLHLVGRGGLVDADPDPVAFPDTMIRIRLHDHFYMPRLFAVFWNSPAIREQIEPRAKTTAGIYKVNQQDIGSMAIPLMPSPEQYALMNELDRLATAQGNLSQLLGTTHRRSGRLRQAVLKRAFAGQLVA